MITQMMDGLARLMGVGTAATVPGILGLIAIFVLVALLTSKELLRAYGGPQSERWMPALNKAILPFFLIFTVVMAIRLWHLLRTAGVL